MQKDQQQLLILGALLHDIGKFAQRAGRPKSKDDVGYCPTSAQHYPTHTHVLYTDYFIEQDLPLPVGLEQQRSKLARLAASHHKPAADAPLEQALKIADCLSSGADRIGGEGEDGNYKSARLVSVFDQISLKADGIDWQKIPEKKRHYHQLLPIDDPQAAFPVSRTQAAQPGYSELFKTFLQQLQTVPLDYGVDAYLSSIQTLLEKFTWSIPSCTYKSMPDISLYDHALTTAALAQALAIHQQQTGIACGSQQETAKKFILVGGDLSGIQKYIFGLDKSQAAGVAKMFRARSFYLQMINHSVIRDLLQRLNLHSVAKIMDAGGRFILLVPATEQNREILDHFEISVQRWFYQQFRGLLSLNFSYATELSESELSQKKFGDCLDRFNDHLEQQKLHKFRRLFAAGCSAVMPLDTSDYEENGVCKLCQLEAAQTSASTAFAQHNHGKILEICPQCQSLIDNIGTKLPTSDYLVLTKTADEKVALPLFGNLQLHFVKKLTPQHKAAGVVEIVNLKQRGAFSYHAVAGHLPMITEKDIVQWSHNGQITQHDDNYRYKDDPVEIGKPKTFQLLAESAYAVSEYSDQPRGKALLGAFKADVDNLGFIFSIGLGQRISISRFTCMSRMLNHFFAEHLVARIERDYPDIYLVFAGGDDLFLLGPWTTVVKFAAVIGEEFKRYVGNNPDITLSAGLSVVKPLLPMHSMVDDAESLLEKSKQHSENSADGQTKIHKNAVTLFGETTDWNTYNQLLEQGDFYLKLLAEEKVTTGLIGRLLEYSRMNKSFENGNIRNGVYLSHMTYDFTRNLKIKDQGEHDKFVQVKQQGNLKHIEQPVTYALYRWRSDR